MVGFPLPCQSCRQKDPLGYTRRSSWRSQLWASWTDWPDRLQPICRSVNTKQQDSNVSAPFYYHWVISLKTQITKLWTLTTTTKTNLELNGSFLPCSHSWQIDVFDDLPTQFNINTIWAHGELEAHRLMCLSHLSIELSWKSKRRLFGWLGSNSRVMNAFPMKKILSKECTIHFYRQFQVSNQHNVHVFGLE